MNSKQRLVLFAALTALILIFVFPPYSVDTGLIGGTTYVFFRKPPDPSDIPLYNWWLVKWELFWVAAYAYGGWVALDTRTALLARRIFQVSLLLQTVFFVSSIPHLSGILEPEFTWLVLNILAVVTSTLLFVWNKKARRADSTPGT